MDKCRDCRFYKRPNKCTRYPPQGYPTKEYPYRVHWEDSVTIVDPNRVACGEFKKKKD